MENKLSIRNNLRGSGIKIPETKSGRTSFYVMNEGSLKPARLNWSPKTKLFKMSTEEQINDIVADKITILAMNNNYYETKQQMLDDNSITMMHIDRTNEDYFSHVLSAYVPKKVKINFSRDFDSVNDSIDSERFKEQLFELFFCVNLEDIYDYYSLSKDEIVSVLTQITRRAEENKLLSEEDIEWLRHPGNMEEICRFILEYQNYSGYIPKMNKPNIYLYKNRDGILECKFKSLFMSKKEYLEIVVSQWCEYVFETDLDIFTPFEAFAMYLKRTTYPFEKERFKDYLDWYFEDYYSISNLDEFLKRKLKYVEQDKKEGDI